MLFQLNRAASFLTLLTFLRDKEKQQLKINKSEGEGERKALYEVLGSQLGVESTGKPQNEQATYIKGKFFRTVFRDDQLPAQSWGFGTPRFP